MFRPLLAPLALLLGCAPGASAATPDGSPPAPASAAPPPVPTAALAATATLAPTASASAAASARAPGKPLTGTLGGSPFSPVSAVTMGRLHKGRVLIGLFEDAADCLQAPKRRSGARVVMMQIGWRAGAVEFAADPTSEGAIVNPKWSLYEPGKKAQPADLEATGTAALIGPLLVLDLVAGADSLKGEIALQACGGLALPEPQEGESPPAK